MSGHESPRGRSPFLISVFRLFMTERTPPFTFQLDSNVSVHMVSMSILVSIRIHYFKSQGPHRFSWVYTTIYQLHRWRSLGVENLPRIFSSVFKSGRRQRPDSKNDEIILCSLDYDTDNIRLGN